MEKVFLKKSITMLTTIFILTIILSFSLSNNNAIGYDYERSSYWDGSSLNINPIMSYNFDSKYRPFKTIGESVENVDPSKIYVIEEAYDLYRLSVLCLGDEALIYLDLHYVLGNDINYDTASERGFLVHPIGFETNKPFTGTFDGQGFEIHELFFEPVSSMEEYETVYNNVLRYYSLFSIVGTTGVVKNVGLINPIMIQPIDWGIMRYAAPIVGHNYGLVENVYVIDTRVDTGISVDGDFYLSGIMSINDGIFRDAFIATKSVRSHAVTSNLGVRPALYENKATMSRVYYDSEIYLDFIIGSAIVTGLSTIDFQNPSYFGDSWYFNNSYNPSNPQSFLNNTYPILKGFNVDQQGRLEISSAANLLYLSSLLEKSIYYRQKTYILTRDIDMNAISGDGYIAPSSTFEGIFTSAIISDPENTTIYPRENSYGAINYYSIVGMSISKGVVIGTATTGTYVSYGLFGVNSGTIENINIIGANITPSDLSDHILKTRSVFGVAVGHLNNGIINNVHVNGNIILPDTSMGKTFIGGLVGYGSGAISNSTTYGDINGGIHPYNVTNDMSSVGGIIGHSTGTSIATIINQINVTGISFNQTTNSTVFVGGIIGSGMTKGLSEALNLGNIISYSEQGIVNRIYTGGIVGLHSRDNGGVYRVNNKGYVNLLVKSPIYGKISGFGNIQSNSQYNAYSIANEGNIFLSYINDHNDFTIAQLENIKIEMAGVAIVSGTNSYFQGVYNKSNFTIDMSICNNFAANILFNNNYSLVSGQSVYDNVSFNYGTSSVVIQSYNEGNINAITTNLVTSYQIKLSGNILGKNISYDQLRNTGNIMVHFYHATTKLLSSAPDADGVVMPYKNLKVMGILEEVSNNKNAHNLYNGGKISVTMNPGLIVKFNLYLSGIAYKNTNTAFYAANSIDYKSIEMESNIKGSLHNCINDGEIYSKGEFYGQSRISGIVSINASMISSAFNTGNIYNENLIRQVQAGDTYSSNEFEVETGGITFLMSGPYAQIKNSANYGTITSYASSTFGWVNASGIAVRNEKTENGTDYGSSSTVGSHFGKIQFTVNYGTVFAWNPVNETSYGLNNETRCKAAGVLALGVLSTVNVVNYGNIYSRYLASGIYGFVFFQKFTIGQNEVYIANLINYGKIRRLISSGSGTGVPFAYNAATGDTIITNSNLIDQNYVPKSENYSSFGALIGKIHTNSTQWTFVSGDFSIINVIFSYLINFDSLIDVIGQSPNANIAANNVNSQYTTNLVNSINYFMSTVKLNDNSKYPFNRIRSYTLDSAPLTGQTGLPGTSTTVSGIFHKSFSLRTPPEQYSFITDQFIYDYIQFIPYSKVNPNLASSIGLDSVGNLYGDETGIYSLSSAAGIDHGEFIPDNVDFINLSPIRLVNGDIVYDTGWLDEIVSGGKTLSYKFNTGMKQLSKSISSAVFNMELICNENSDIILKYPEIDIDNKMITYYVPSNSVASKPGYGLSTVVRYEEAGPNVPGSLFIPYQYNSTDGKWVGNHKLSNGEFIPIGPYALTGIYNVDFTGNSGEHNWYFNDGVSGPIFNPVTNTWSQHKFYHYERPNASGVGIKLHTIGTEVGPGYGPYRLEISGRERYFYVGPTSEPITYMVYEEITPVYVDSWSFRPNINSNYLLAKNASFKYNHNGNFYAYGGNIDARVPKIPGIYDELYDDAGNFLDRMSDHFGLVRVYAEAYDHNQGTDAYTYTDYTIRIVRTISQEITDASSVLVNGIESRPILITNIRSVFISARSIHFKPEGDLGTIEINYVTNNVQNGINLLENTKLTLYNSSVPIDENLYRIDGGTVQTNGDFNYILGSWGEGSVTFKITITEELANAHYSFHLSLDENDIYSLHFLKSTSTDGFVKSISFNEELITFDSPIMSLDSYIPFGIYHNIQDLQTKIVNFSNLSSIVNVSANNLHNLYPLYLDSISISPHARINSVTLTVQPNPADSYRYIYTLLYKIRAENGVVYDFTHRLIEKELPTAIEKTYRDGNMIETLPIDSIIFEREASPTFRIDYFLDDVYFFNNQELNITLDFSGNTIIPVLNEDYFIIKYPNMGFIVEFSNNAPVGNYQFLVSYSVTKTLSTGQVMNWNRAFQSILIVKDRNGNSHLRNVTFVTDTVYTGLDTILDIYEMDAETYIAYLLDRWLREIITLPNSGINYNDYAGYNAYWVVGQVQKTNLINYTPSFYLPYGATIYRITDPANIQYPEMQSTELATDFNPIGDTNEFNYIHYRTYAEDYNPYEPTLSNLYTDYYIAVQDVTNNVRFGLRVNIDPSITEIIFDKLYITFNVFDNGDITLSMSLFSYFYKINYNGTNNQFSSSTSGDYQILVDLPIEYTYTVKFKNISLPQNQFSIEDSVIPRMYQIEITIIESGLTPPWGQTGSGDVESNIG